MESVKKKEEEILEYRFRRYEQAIRPRHVRPHARNILESVEPGYQRYRYAAALVAHVFNHVSYRESNDLWRADYILDQSLQGDCEDQTLCAASLLRARSFDVRLLALNTDGKTTGHLVGQVRFPAESNLEDLVKEAQRHYNDSSGGLVWDFDDGFWLLFDTTSSPVLGCSTSYADFEPDGEIRWKEETQVRMIHVGD